MCHLVCTKLRNKKGRRAKKYKNLLFIIFLPCVYLKRMTGPPIRKYFFKNPEIQSDFASKSESDIDILRRVGDALSTPLPLTSYMFTF